jgi:phenylalanyl-tRNA synthetase beta chain
MGGADSEVGEGTTRVILESAIFHGPSVRNTARRLGLRSEASMRHEKGISPDLPRYAADRAAALIAQITGARIAPGIVDNDPGPHPPHVIEVDLARATRLLGFPVDAASAEATLAPLGFGTAASGDGRLTVTVPLHRRDVVVEADVAEEIARAHGYDRIPDPLPRAALPATRADPAEPRHRLRRVLAGLGLDEVVTHALIGPADLSRSGFDPVAAHLVRIANPLSEEHGILRPVPYPSVLGALAENVRQRRTDLALFEVGKIYRYRPTAASGELPQAAGTYHEAWTAAIGLLGSTGPRYPGDAARGWEVADLKGIIDAAHLALGLPAPAYRAEGEGERHPHLHPGRAARVVTAEGRAYGSVGEVHPAVAAAWGLPGRPLLAALHLEPNGLLGLPTVAPNVAAAPAAQPVDRDLAVVLDEATPVGELLRLARRNGGPLLVDLRLFDVYRGEQAGPGMVSYGLGLRFQPTTAGEEQAVDRAMDKIRGALRHHLGATIR